MTSAPEGCFTRIHKSLYYLLVNRGRQGGVDFSINAINLIKMNSDSEENNSGNESLANFEEETEGLAVDVGAAAIDNDEAEFDRPYMGEPLADEIWLRNYNDERGEERQRQEMLLRRLDGTFPVESW